MKGALFLLSFTALFFQIVLIRWIPASVPLVAYFTNLILLGSFLGLGLGFLLTGFPVRLEILFFPLLLNLTLAAAGIAHWPAGDPTGAGSERFLGITLGGPLLFLGPLAAIFLLTTAVFIPLGQGIGRGFASLPPLTAYAVNLSGSLAGLMTYGGLTSLYTKPPVWFSLGGVIFLVAAGFRFRQLLWTGIVAALILWHMAVFQGKAQWSPYHRISTQPLVGMATGQSVGFDVFANQTGFVRTVDLSDRMVAQEPRLRGARACYGFPYRLIQPQRVLVLGAGTGNDVAAAVRAGATEIDAVEIEPLLVALGKAGHPEAPFSHPAVRTHVTDGRAFVERATGLYDLIVLGYLDSQRLLSHFSSVRLDNFMYTAESFRRLKALLAPEGLLCVAYATTQDWLGGRISAMLTQAFGEPPLAYQGSSYKPGDMVIFLSGPTAQDAPPLSVEGFSPTTRYRLSVEPATDDWPYLYVPRRHLPGHYAAMIIAILGMSGSLFGLLFPVFPRWDKPLFFLGAGFMLVEAKAVTRVALLFGSTWTVNLWVISAVLLMALGSAGIASRLRGARVGAWFLALGCALALDGFVAPATVQRIFGSDLGRLLASALAVGPLLFSGVIFALLFKQARNPQAAFGWNLLGAMVGGLLEYLSLAVGFQALSLVIAALYALAFFTRSLRV